MKDSGHHQKYDVFTAVDWHGTVKVALCLLQLSLSKVGRQIIHLTVDLQYVVSMMFAPQHMTGSLRFRFLVVVDDYLSV